MHLPCAIACASAGAFLVYFVASVTVTVVCAELPLGSALFTVIVVPETDATWPVVGACLAGAPDGGVESAGWCLGSGHLPSTAVLMRIQPAVTPLPAGASPLRSGRTLTQLPAVTSVS